MANEELDKDLGKHALALRANLPGVYRSLVLAKSKASTSPDYSPRYKSLLKQSIARLEADKADIQSDDELENGVRELLAWYDGEADSRNIASIERERGKLSHQQWMQKWFPKEWAKFSKAYKRVVDTGTRSAVADMRPVSLALMDAYTGAFDGVRHTD